MVTTLLDARSGNKAEVSPDTEVKSEEYNHDLERACGDLLSALERKSIPDLMKASRDVHTELHKEPPFENVPESEEQE